MLHTPKRIIKRWVKKPLESLYWNLHSRTLMNPPLDRTPRLVCFVCKGNICRSPYAQLSAVRALAGGQWKNLRFESAGLMVDQPEDSPLEALAAAQALGIDMSAHRSRRVDAETLGDCDMVFAMEVWQLERLRAHYPAYTGRFFLLPLFDPIEAAAAVHRYNIEDPYGKPAERFRECFLRIDRCIAEVFRRIP
jgi:protein-tyrosine phosphatase